MRCPGPRAPLSAPNTASTDPEKEESVHHLGFCWGWNHSLGELGTRPIENFSTIGNEEVMEHERKHTRPRSLSLVGPRILGNMIGTSESFPTTRRRNGGAHGSSCPNVMSDDSQKLVQAIGLCKDLLSDIYPSGSFNAGYKDEGRHRAAEQFARGRKKLSPVHPTHGEIAK